MFWLLIIVGACVVFSVSYVIGHGRGYKAGTIDERLRADDILSSVIAHGETLTSARVSLADFDKLTRE